VFGKFNYTYPHRKVNFIKYTNEMSTIKVSRSTLAELEALREAMKARSVEEVIKRFLAERRQRTLEEVFGVDKGRLRPFTEEDRG
jgi:predicted CopG family antitoxin